MFSDRVFQIALAVSILTHGIILSQSTNLNVFPFHKKEEKTVVSYVKENLKALDYQKTVPKYADARVKTPPKIAAKKLPPPPFAERDAIFRRDETNILSGPAVKKPVLVKPDIIAVKKKITLPAVDIDKINNPSYLNYYQIVREKIRRAAYQNFTRTETGEAYLSFIISKEGSLKELRLVEEKSSSNQYLRGIALRSLRESSPFPSFPQELDYPQLSFNVVISFEIE